MWTLSRKRKQQHEISATTAPAAGTATASGGTATADRPIAEFTGSIEELLAQIQHITERNRQSPTREAGQELVQLRNVAGIRRIDGATAGAEFPEPDYAALPDAAALPEIAGSEVTPGLLRAGILRRGCLLVRNVVPRADAVQFAQQIDRPFDERDRHDAGERYDEDRYAEFVPDPRMGTEFLRPWIKSGGGVLAVDSPKLCFEMMQMFARAGLLELVQGYLGEPVLITAQKTTLRKAAPSVPGAWHQDGRFMGQVRALNLWLSLSRCGDESPGLDIVPRRLEDFVTTETDEAAFNHMISQRQAELAAGETGIMRPIFEPGDALFFDDLFLHKTGSDPSMPKPRFAIENWFFGGSAFPMEYAPIAV
jgi:hypothetical protein